jgi:hypothetical protein
MRMAGIEEAADERRALAILALLQDNVADVTALPDCIQIQLK